MQAKVNAEQGSVVHDNTAPDNAHFRRNSVLRVLVVSGVLLILLGLTFDLRERINTVHAQLANLSHAYLSMVRSKEKTQKPGHIASQLLQQLNLFYDEESYHQKTQLILTEWRDSHLIILFDSAAETQTALSAQQQTSLYGAAWPETRLSNTPPESPIRKALTVNNHAGFYFDYRNELVIANYTSLPMGKRRFVLVAKMSLFELLKPVLSRFALLLLVFIFLIRYLTRRISALIESLISDLVSHRDHLNKSFELQTVEVNAIVNTAVSAIITINKAGIVQSFNPAAENMFGYAAEEIIGRNVSVLVSDLDTARGHDEFVSNYLETGDAKIIGTGRDTNAVRKNGSSFPIHLSVGHFVAKGEEDRFVGIINDTTKYTNTLDELQESRIRLNTLIGSVSSLIYMKDTQGRYQIINRSFEKRLGGQNIEIIGKKDDAIMPEKVAKLLMEADKRVMAMTQTLQLDERIIDIDGQERWYKTEKTAIRDDGGNVIGICGISTDITESRKLQTELKMSEEKFRSLVDNIPGVSYRCILDNERETEFISQAIYELTGHQPEKFLAQGGYSLDDIVYAEDKKQLHQTIIESAKLGQSYTIEYRLLSKALDIRWVREKGRARIIKNTNKYLVDAAIFDISDRKESEIELMRAKELAESANLAKATFLANMSHEIRTPLNAIIGFLDLTVAGELNKNQRQHINVATRSAYSLLHIINDILDVSKIEAGKLKLESVNFNLPELIDDCLSTLYHQAEVKNLTLSHHLSKNLAKIYIGDPTRLRQILLNLLGNAIKFTDTGTVQLRVEPVESNQEQVHFTVIDTGIGIGQAQQELIFQPFSQADVSTSRRFGGTGLGTTISKQLVELMGGKIWLKSQENQGSEFHFKIDLTISASQDINLGDLDIGEQTTSFSSRALNILLVEDIEENAQLALIRLNACGHKVTWAENGLEAIAAVETSEFDIILMDIQMPKMDGLTASVKIRLQGIITPIIAFTASVMDNERQECLDAGMNAIVSKPVQFPILFKTINGLLAIPTQENASRILFKPTSKVVNNIDLSPIVDDVDIDSALERWREPEKLLKSLQSFVARRYQVADEMGSDLRDQNYPAIQSTCHALRGVTGNLGLFNLSHLAGDIESNITSGDYERNAKLIDQLDVYMKQLAANIKKVIVPRQQAVFQPDISRELQEEKLHQFIRFLEAQDLDRAEDLLLELGVMIPDVILESIDKALQDFDFELAIVSCQRHLTEIQNQT